MSKGMGMAWVPTINECKPDNFACLLQKEGLGLRVCKISSQKEFALILHNTIEADIRYNRQQSTC